MNNDKTNQSMSLSQAMRLGAMLCPQETTGVTFDGEARCAMASAALAIGHDLRLFCTSETFLRATWPVLSHRAPAHDCPLTAPGLDVLARVLHLNDKHHWTRERIADFVEQIETTISHSTNMEAVGVGEKVGA